MILRPLSASSLCRFSLLPFLIAAVFFGMGCNHQAAEEAEVILAQTLDPTPPNDCEPGYYVEFPLETETFEAGDVEFETHVETGTYILDECKCLIESFELVFEGMDSTWTLLVLNSAENALDFEVKYDESGRAHILIRNPENLPDGNLTVLFDFQGEGEGPGPTLVSAGGLCIVENVITGDDGTPKVLPYKLTQSSGTGATTTRVYVSPEIGFPSN